MARSTTSDPSVTIARELRVLVGRLRRQLMDASATGELSSAQASVLARLAKDEPSSASRLAGAERVRPQSMATTLATLFELGLVRREPDPEDGRRQLIFLTPAGRSYADGARASREEWLVGALHELTEAERRTLSEALVLLVRVVGS